MPLYPDGRALIRANLDALANGDRAKLVAIGRLTDVQAEAINVERRSHGFPPIDAEVVFIGKHIFDSRMLRDGYEVEDVVDQIAAAMDGSAVVRQSSRMTIVENTIPRPDRYLNKVLDRAVLECSARYPRPELYSVIPKGDVNKPKKKPLTCDERLEPQRLARVTVTSGAPAAATVSMRQAGQRVNKPSE